MGRPARMQVGAVTVATARPRALARFYSALLGWPYVREEVPKPGEPPDGGYALVCAPDGVAEPALNFEYDPHYRPPAWPSVDGGQVATQHLDVGVDDLDSAVAWAVECGATLADFQPSQTHRVLLDPDGHPFCLCL
ncbi:VOC family protein [Actinopolymorpha rutila]|uniref:Catechol 2,3-dioxygenase-like lactoylglutathione lyase family enzyme n=1 Tax=Actinopolymorpha rutila TaxID=446787 RepID=A0A852ZG69_9ACTN|nr:VOC family protein [Actinopolymorpha rutila]NYH92171.1 catechol 2,3-dioxygenase-like lactoylglutathione lyase family enzyme [Actinopolymorpha rutila]